MGRSEVLARERAARTALREAVDDLRDARVAAGAVRERPDGGDGPRRWPLCCRLPWPAGVSRWYDASGHTTDADYEQAATDRVTMLLSPDYWQPGRAQRILAGATGEFYDEFAQSADAYTKFVKSRGTVAEGTVDGAAISGRTPDARPFWWRPRSASPAHKTSGPRASGCGCSWPTPTVVPNSRRCNTTMNATSGDTWSRLPPVLRRPIVGVAPEPSV